MMPNPKPSDDKSSGELEDLQEVLIRMEHLLQDARSLARASSEQQTRILVRLEEANRELLRLRRQTEGHKQ